MLNIVVYLHYIEFFTLSSALRLYIHNDVGFFSWDHDCQEASRLIHRVIGQNFHGRKQTIYTRRDPSPGDSRLEVSNFDINKHKIFDEGAS